MGSLRISFKIRGIACLRGFPHKHAMRCYLSFFAVWLGVSFYSNAQAESGRSMIYNDPSKSIDSRVDDLLSLMSIEEKTAQMLCLWNEKNKLLDSEGRFDLAKAAKFLPNGVGHIARPSDNFGRQTTQRTRSIKETVDFVNAVQRFMVEKTRLGIPVLFHEEGLHGYMAKDATHFPQAIALAGTWDPELIERVYTVVASEIRARGVHLVLSPVVDVGRDPRWGRIEETFGEDPFLTAEMGVSAVRGFQGNSPLIGPGRVFATLKHMTGHGQPESGVNTAPAAIPERMLREMFLPPFERAIKEAGAMAVMPSYNEIDGVPSHANGFLLTNILRNEWDFQGMVVSDYFAIADLSLHHYVAGSMEDAAVQALDAGVDVELPDPNAFRRLSDLVRTGKVKESSIDNSVRRIVRAKFMAGLFENPYADVNDAERTTGNEAARACALTAAQQSIVLLKNEKRLLPLDRAALKKIAVVGPNAAETVLGGYSETPKQTISILEGIRKKLGKGVQVDFAQGVRITKNRGWWEDNVELADSLGNRKLISEAVKTVKGADFTVVVVGDNEQTSREGWADNHLGDRSSLDLVGQQNDLVEAVIETGVPTIVILINGRPLTVNYIAEHAQAILEGWYLGQETGTAIADVLFGDINPGGKLPITIPRSVGQLPVFYNCKSTARRGYLFGTTEPLFPFGFGLSYTTFKFENLRLSKTKITAHENVVVEADVVNTGKYKGDEVVQLYIRDAMSSVTRPVKELKGFKRITLKPDERRTVSFTLLPSHLSMYNKEMKRVVEPGEFEIMVGPNSVELQKIVLTVRE
jgi:beta-glucosidase